MNNAIDEFLRRLRSEWLPSFCAARAEDFQPEGFLEGSVQTLSEYDAEWFLKAVDGKLVVENAGIFRGKNGAIRDQIFWSGRRGSNVRALTLWVEPVITIGAVARLVMTFGWPPEFVSSQPSSPSPFDFSCFVPSSKFKRILGEVKKTDTELEALIWSMKVMGTHLPFDVEPSKRAERNAYRKVVGLRARWPDFFWALGPQVIGAVYSIRRVGPTEFFEMDLVSEGFLDFATPQQK